MITSLIFFRRRPGMSLDAFHAHWRTCHAGLVLKLPGLRRYVQNYLVADGGAAPFDAVAESSFDDTQAMKALGGTPAYAAVLADELNFIDRASMGAIITEARTLRDADLAPGTAKRIAFVARPAQMPVEEFFRRWREDGERRAATGGIRRHVQCAVRRAVYDSGRTPAFDGAEMAWFDPGAAGAIEPGFGEVSALVVDERIVA